MQRKSLAAYKALDAYNDVLWARMFNPFCDIEHFPPITFVIHANYLTASCHGTLPINSRSFCFVYCLMSVCTPQDDITQGGKQSLSCPQGNTDDKLAQV